MMGRLDSMTAGGYSLDSTNEPFYNAFSSLETVCTGGTRASDL